MAAADITIGGECATLECDDSKHLITLTSPRGSLVNIGTESVYLRIGKDAAALDRDGAERDGEIELKPNGTAPVRIGQKYIQRQCAVGKTTTIQWYPDLA